MNIDQLKKVIKTANPEIMELKFGCEVRFLKNKDGDVIVNYSDDGDLHPILTVNSGYIRVQQIEILGRPIRLADVLLAIGEQGLACRINEEGEFVSWTAKSQEANKYLGTDDEGNSIAICWNLKEDSLDKQSEETLDFLTQLLCK